MDDFPALPAHRRHDFAMRTDRQRASPAARTRRPAVTPRLTSRRRPVSGLRGLRAFPRRRVADAVAVFGARAVRACLPLRGQHRLSTRLVPRHSCFPFHRRRSSAQSSGTSVRGSVPTTSRSPVVDQKRGDTINIHARRRMISGPTAREQGHELARRCSRCGGKPPAAPATCDAVQGGLAETRGRVDEADRRIDALVERLAAIAVRRRDRAPMEHPTVTIHDREYRLACAPEDKHGAAAVLRAYVDAQCIRSVGGKVMGADRIAVMAALQIAQELFAARQRRRHDLGELRRRVRDCSDTGRRDAGAAGEIVLIPVGGLHAGPGRDTIRLNSLPCADAARQQGFPCGVRAKAFCSLNLCALRKVAGLASRCDRHASAEPKRRGQRPP